MHVLRRMLLPLACASLAVMMAGCGGGSGGTSGGGGNNGQSASLGVFVSDSMMDTYDHVWVTILKVELLKADGSAVTTYDDATGQTIDLRTLRDSTGARFSFLGNATVPEGTYTGVRVTIAPTITLYPRGSSTGTATPVSDTFPKDGQGNPQINLTFPQPHMFGGVADNIVIDFDLANFVLSGGKITPHLRDGDKTGLGDHHRHERGIYEGIVGSLSGAAPNFTFTLQHANNAPINVTTDSTTSIFNASGQPNPALANGQRVQVRGVFDIASKTLAATDVKIQDVTPPPAEHLVGVIGTASAMDATAGTFTVNAQKVKGFMPAQAAINVVTNTDTVYRADGGVKLTQSDFFTQLATATAVMVEGTYDASSNTLTASLAMLDTEEEEHGGHGGPGMGHMVEVRGTVTNPSAADGTFTIHLVKEFDGFVLSGDGPSVVTNSSTVFRNASGQTISQSDFFAAVTSTTTVRVRGTLANKTLTAQSVMITG